MICKWLSPIILILLFFDLKADAPVEIRRICKNSRNNNIFFYPSTDPCTGYFQYKIWGRNGIVGPYILIDSINTKNVDQYIHIEANPGIATNWSYFIVITDSCGPDYETYSDTVSVDEEAPVSTFIDSVSVDPNTNKVNIGWRSNPSSDFSYYIVYRDSLGNNIPVSNNSKDTFMIDNRPSSNPVLEAIKYDISTVDSCDNRKIFNINPHTTMRLQLKTDTCSRKTTLIWSQYIGWNQIKVYYIYRKTAGGSYILVDSVIPPNTEYSDTITLGESYFYYIRAVKDTTVILSSSSNSVSFTTRFRIEPTLSYISSISVSSNSAVSVKIYNPSQEVKKYDLLGASDVDASFEFISSLAASPVISGYEKTIPLQPEYKYIKAKAINACNEEFLSTNTSRYITLNVTGETAHNNLKWETYFTWNVGVNYYRIYRGTNNAQGEIIYSLLDSVPGFDSTYKDSLLPSIVGENGLCYYVEAIQNSGDINGSIETAASTRACVIGDLLVYIPNAFRPTGINKTFRPEGSYIDYSNSVMEIYDRWGGKLIGLHDIRSGWDGIDGSGIRCMQGVYYYKLFIKSTNGKEKIYTGFVTLLD